MAAARQGRQRINVEFLRKLKDLSGIERLDVFAKRCGKEPPNMGNYLSGKKTPRDDTLRGCLQHLYEWNIEPLLEMQEMSELSDLPTSPGVYMLYDSGCNLLYLGQAKTFSIEVPQTLNDLHVPMRCNRNLNWSYIPIRELATHLSLYKIESKRLRHNIEALLLRVISNQTYNSNIGHFQ